jgi:neurofibromin 1
MALLNLGSPDPNLRTAAYNHLCALTATFDLKIEGQLLETSGKPVLNICNSKIVTTEQDVKLSIPVSAFTRQAMLYQVRCPVTPI